MGEFDDNEHLNENRGDVGNTEKMEIFRFSWKVPRKVGKNILKFEIFAEVGKFRCNWKVLLAVTAVGQCGRIVKGHARTPEKNTD